MAPLWMADAIGAFARNHVTVSLRLIADSVAVPALIAREVDVIQLSGAPILTAGVAGAGPAIVASLLSHSVSSLYVPSSIKGAADLKGKVLADDKPGTPNDFTIHKALAQLGLQESDVQLQRVGSADVAWPALQSGQVQGAMLSPPLSFQADAAGYRLLQDTFSIPYQATAVAVLQQRLSELSPAMPGLLLGYREGTKAYNEQPDLAQKVLAQYTKEQDPTRLKQTYDFYRTKAPFDPTLQPNVAGLQSMLEFLVSSGTLPAGKSFKAEQFVDTRFVSALPPEAS